jgi:hypothetical protein
MNKWPKNDLIKERIFIGEKRLELPAFLWKVALGYLLALVVAESLTTFIAPMAGYDSTAGTIRENLLVSTHRNSIIHGCIYRDPSNQIELQRDWSPSHEARCSSSAANWSHRHRDRIHRISYIAAQSIYIRFELESTLAAGSDPAYFYRSFG